LLATMRAWYDWLGKLENDSQRTRLRGLEPADRVVEVQRIRLRQAEQFFGFELPQADVQKLFTWTADFVETNQEKIDAMFSRSMSERSGNSASRREWMARRPDIQFVILYNMQPDVALSLIDNEDLGMLKASLSSKGNEQLDAQPDDDSRKRLVYRWVISAIEAQRRPPPWELKNFYEFEMSAEQKQRVDNMDRQQRQREIIRLYNRSRDRTQFGMGSERPGNERRGRTGSQSRSGKLPNNDNSD
ncbi:MAG: hypothetical protein ACR2NP_10695, partial [Pirellulaceae bacterium]